MPTIYKLVIFPLIYGLVLGPHGLLLSIEKRGRCCGGIIVCGREVVGERNTKSHSFDALRPLLRALIFTDFILLNIDCKLLLTDF
jgi:hypothetical protein